MRGKLIVRVCRHGQPRITPAGAGKTQQGAAASRDRQDHPRRCGENFEFLGFSGAPVGITPAGAGKTKPLGKAAQRDEDHPRRCGENGANAQQSGGGDGSPPQVRGKPDTPAEETETDRITPAGAGKTSLQADGSRGARDHPRRCGENGVAGVSTYYTVGSPPQVRGKH